MLVDYSITPLWIQGLYRLVLWIQTLTLVVEQDLCIQVPVLYCSCSKEATFSFESINKMYYKML